MPEGPLGGPRPAVSCNIITSYFYELLEGEADALVNKFTTKAVVKSIEGEKEGKVRIQHVPVTSEKFDLPNRVVIEVTRKINSIKFGTLKDEYNSIFRTLQSKSDKKYKLGTARISEGEPHLIVDCSDPEGITGTERPLANCFLKVTQTYNLDGNINDIKNISDDIMTWISNITREGDVGIVNITQTNSNDVQIIYSLSSGNISADEIHMAYFSVGNAIRDKLPNTDVFPIGVFDNPDIILECV